MTGGVGFLFWVICGLLVMAAWRRIRSLRSPRGRRPDATIDDEAVETIVNDGVLVVEEDEPLDLDEIEDEERRFWEEEDWDQAEEY